MNSEFVKIVIESLITIIGAVVSIYFVPFLKSRITEQQIDEIMKFTEKCVQAAEKLYTPEQWEDKKEYVYNLVSKRAVIIGIDLDVDEIDSIIEGYVKAVKG